MKLIANEGTVTIYQIEAQYPDNVRMRPHRGSWYVPNTLGQSAFGERPARYGESWENACPIYKEYSANGDCWQKTGIHGFLDERLALRAIELVMRHAQPSVYITNWRLVRREVRVRVDVLQQFPAKQASAAYSKMADKLVELLAASPAQPQARGERG